MDGRAGAGFRGWNSTETNIWWQTRVMAILKKRRVLALMVAVVLVVFAANAGRMLVVDSPQRSDVILVLAGETELRPARALELLGQGYGRRVV